MKAFNSNYQNFHEHFSFLYIPFCQLLIWLTSMYVCSGEGQASWRLQTSQSCVRVRGQDPDHRIQPHEWAPGGTVGSCKYILCFRSALFFFIVVNIWSGSEKLIKVALRQEHILLLGFKTRFWSTSNVDYCSFTSKWLTQVCVCRKTLVSPWPCRSWTPAVGWCYLSLTLTLV